VRNAQRVALKNQRKSFRMLADVLPPADDYAAQLQAKFPPAAPVTVIPFAPDDRERLVPPLKTVEELRKGTSTKPGVFRVQAIRAHLRSKKHHGAGDLTGLQMREKMLVLFETDDKELHSLLFKHCMYYVTSGLIPIWISSPRAETP
jgi:hypothetical protein